MFQTASLYVILLVGQFFALYHLIIGIRMRRLLRCLFAIALLLGSWHYLRQVGEQSERERAAERPAYPIISLPQVSK